MHTLYFTRHGETVWNVENKICGMTDSPLTERGRQQARKLGEAVKASGVHIDEILYSPLSRAADTAMAIAEATGNRYFTDILSHLGTSIIPRTRVNSASLAREHEQIFEAIARQDAEAARAAMRLHLTNSRERLRQAHEAAEAEALHG